MKITKSQLKKVIEEEINEIWAEGPHLGSPENYPRPKPRSTEHTPRKKELGLEPTVTQELAPDELPSAEKPSKGGLSERLANLEGRFQEFMDVFFAWQAKQDLAMSEEKER